MFYYQLKKFAYQTLLQEFNISSDQYTDALTKWDRSQIVELSGKAKIEMYYYCEI